MKKISRKDLAKMSTGEILRAGREPYKRLAQYVKPYRRRFALGIFFGLLAGAASSALVLLTRVVGDVVLGSSGHHAAAEAKPGLLTQLGHFTAPDWLPAAALVTEWVRGFSGWLLHLLPPPGTHDLNQVAWICSLLPLVMMLRGVFGYLNAYCMQWVSLRTLDDIRQQVYESVLAQSQEFYNKQKTGDLIQTIFNQTRMAQMALTQIASDLVKQPATLLGSVFTMLLIDWKFTLVSFLIFPLCLIPVLIIGKKVRQSSNREEEEAGSLMTLMHEAIGGIRIVKAHTREDYEAKRFQRANQSMLSMMMRWRKAMELSTPLVETVAAIGISAALVYAAKFKLTPGEFIGLNAALVMMYEPAKALGKLHILLQKCLAATTKIFELMDRPSAVADHAESRKLSGRAKGDIEFRGVTFGYNLRQPAVRGIDLIIPAGTTCAVVGATGSGKSTLVSLLMRFYDPDEGSIHIDGHDIRELTQKSLRAQFGLVNQDLFLFHDTIAANIRYGKLDATDEEIEAAARRAHAHSFIIEQREGYETVVGDRGTNLSGGQRQRLCIARAFLRDAPILVLDEATSALDSETEANIQADLDELSKNRTVIAIAHRLSTIVNADQIVVMSEGQIIDSGRHQELLTRNDIYQRLFRTQFEAGLAEAT